MVNKWATRSTQQLPQEMLDTNVQARFTQVGLHMLKKYPNSIQQANNQAING